MDNTTVDKKAKELIEKFLTKVGQECEHDSYCDKPECCYNGKVHCVVNLDIAKQCALISINREIEVVNRLLKTGLNNDFDLMRERGELQEVLNQIQSL